MAVQEMNLSKTCQVMSFRDPYDVIDDVISDHARIGTCDMLSVFQCIRLILNSFFRLKTDKGSDDRFYP